MTAKVTSRLSSRSLIQVKDRLAGASCREEKSNPSWWTDDHRHKGHFNCEHELARHICLTHCPVLDLCSKDMLRPGTDWTGMVVAGQVRDKVGRATTVRKPPRRRKDCPHCP